MIYKDVFLLLGSNLGDRMSNLTKCKALIETHAGKIVKQSSIYETAAWGKTDQPDFLNQAIEIETQLEPNELLKLCLEIEKQIGRQRQEKWGARTIDVDIIYFGEQVIATSELQIPHPQMAERKFVVMPLVEISPNFVHPVLKKTNAQLLKECEDRLEVRKTSSQEL